MVNNPGLDFDHDRAPAQGVSRPPALLLMHAMDYPREHLTPTGLGSAYCPHYSDFPEHRLHPSCSGRTGESNGAHSH